MWRPAARAKQLEPDEVVGGTFTITNPGPYGTFMTLPIINQPQVAILSTDGISKRPVVVEGPDGDDVIAVRHTGILALTWDHRAFDGAYAAAFLTPIASVLETRDWETELAVTHAAGFAGWAGRRTRRPNDLQRALHEPRRRLPAAARAPARVHARHARRPGARARAPRNTSAPSSCAPTAAATSRTTGPGQLVGYPIVTLPEWRDGMRDVVAYVRRLEAVLVAALADLGVEATPTGATRASGSATRRSRRSA